MLKIQSFLLLLLGVFFTFDNADIRNIERNVEITVFVHGAVSLGPLSPVTHFDIFMFDKVSNSIYEKIIKSIRSDSFFFENQPMQEEGLHSINYDTIQPGEATKAFACIFDTVASYVDKNNTYRMYYTYGWDGAFSKQGRKNHAYRLYDALIVECKRLRRKGLNPSVKLVGYCHGAQLILELASLVEEYGDTIPIYIDTAILLSMPIAPDTQSSIASPMFKKVYFISSGSDRVQPIDVFVSKKLWCGRAIEIEENSSIIREKLIQIDLRLYKPRKIHEHKCFDQDNIINRNTWRNQSPGHIEFWFFAWTPANYRYNWILSPFPAAVFLPMIIQYAEEERLYFSCDRQIIIDIRPTLGKIFVRQTNTSITKEKDWISEVLLNKLTTIALSAMPEKKKNQAEYFDRISLHTHKISAENLEKQMI